MPSPEIEVQIETVYAFTQSRPSSRFLEYLRFTSQLIIFGVREDPTTLCSRSHMGGHSIRNFWIMNLQLNFGPRKIFSFTLKMPLSPRIFWNSLMLGEHPCICILTRVSSSMSLRRFQNAKAIEHLYALASDEGLYLTLATLVSYFKQIDNSFH